MKKKYNDIVDDINIEEEFNSEGLLQKKLHIVNEYIINLDDGIASPKEYRKVFELLRNAGEQDIIRFIINTYGGDVYTFVQLYNYIKNTKAITIAEIHSAYSAGAMISLSCDIIEVGEFGSMMFHDISTNNFGKVSEIESYSSFIKKWSKEIIDIMYTGFLTDKEIEKIKTGGDVWLTKKEIEKKLKKWKPIKIEEDI